MNETVKTILLVWTASAIAILALARKGGWRANRWLIAAVLLGPFGVAAALHLEHRREVATTQERAFAQYRALAVVGGALFILCSPFFLLYSVWVTVGMILLGLLPHHCTGNRTTVTGGCSYGAICAAACARVS